MTFQVVCNRNDGRGWVLDGCWGSEEASGEKQSEVQDMCNHLANIYPDCSWGFCDVVDGEPDTSDVTIVSEADDIPTAEWELECELCGVIL